MEETTIANIITPLYESGVGIIRVSGSQALSIVDDLFTPVNQKRYSKKETFTIHLGYIKDQETVLDEVLLLLMKGPNSFTGEDIVEIQTHGNPFILDTILKLLLKKGATLSEAGEFTKRAFLNGRLDLSQGEAILDVIQAKNKKSLQMALNQLEGGLSSKVHNIEKDTLSMIGFLEASIDFPEDEIDSVFSKEDLKKTIHQIIKEINGLLETYHDGKILKEGITTVLVGAPNVGKSTLLNTLLKENRAIVTHIPGTTRDSIEEKTTIGDLILNLVDTAGIRDTEDAIEKIGVEKTYDYIEKSQLILFLLDSTKTVSNEEQQLLDKIKKMKKHYLILNTKIDLAKNTDNLIENSLPISAKDNLGIKDLENAIKKIFLHKNEENIYLTNYRYYEALEKSKKAYLQALEALESAMPYDLVSIDLKEAFEALGIITGTALQENLLNEIFSKFCIGK
ncbi:hypothetical protein AZF37_08955 [endosymbiont 'TC1' of Trimyema compressum]|uniref:tRNA uridine-5-carboxymethylaminomethyl(34) synthesis GTPase MnmE n=1 Tax=endosymbiont 'TC1' of Trimyema compressum TaxID=243899 RepID=UPI0007F0BA66|nr:tRNA uridine-5-carboxymethylaminomethyl(34) synthesis GTPase MnmE [endosymbiont 'TC1' of Trimyema compressum]AMP21254.1 hypothetical protein AZF37_08955 [endosymbiont 'TC1' of Trimyema compressum]